MSQEPVSLPHGDIGVAFDNDQIIQRQYDVRAGGKPRVSILTSVCYALLGNGLLQTKGNLSPRVWMKYDKVKAGDDTLKNELADKIIGSKVIAESFAVVKKEMKKLSQIALEEVVSQHCKDGDNVSDDIDKKVTEIESMMHSKKCPACDAVMKKTARKCPNAECRADFKEATNKLTGR
ncbi:uncharacterized protein [Ptychodera flava]|uniref:uncharacterized protein n=1 Tax=Ptychodera flava TaxID=63121 RepID=UPI00396A4CF0